MSLDKRHLWSGEEIEAFERWEMPDLTGISLRSLGREKISDSFMPPQDEVEEEIPEDVPELPTAEEIEAIRKTAFDEAYAEGFAKGEQEGFAQGREEGFLKGKADGFDEGREQGYQDGLQQGEREINTSLAQLNSILALLHEPIEQQYVELETVLYDLLSKLVRLVTHKELSLDSAVVLETIRDALDLLPRNSERIRVFVHPNDLELAQKQSAQSIDQWHVYADESLTPGGCRVETLHSLIDASVEAQLDDLLVQVVQHRYSRPSEASIPALPSELLSEQSKGLVDKASEELL